MSQPAELRDLTRVVVRGASLSGGGFVLTQVLTLGIYIVLARLASPTIFGTFAAASILASIGELVSESGLRAALIQRRDRLEDALSTAFVAALVGGVVFTVLSAGLAPLVGLFFRSREIALLALAMSAVHLFHSATVVPEAILTRRFAFARRLVVDPSATIAFGLVSAIALARGLGAWGLVLGLYSYGLVRVVLTWALVAWRPSLKLASFSMWRELVGYGRHVLAASILQQATPAVIAALVGRFVGAASLGQYRFGSRIATSVTTPVLAASSYVLFPAFARISTDEHRYGAAFLRALNVLSFYVIPLSFILFAIGEPLTVLLLGDRWRTAGHVLTALCGLGASAAFISIASTALKSSGRPDVQSKLNFVWTGLTVAFASVLLPLGVVGVAVAVSFSAAITAAYALRSAARVIRLRPQQALDAIWPPLAAAGITSSAIAVLERLVFRASHRPTVAGFMLLALELILAASLYLALMGVLRRTMIGEALHPIKLALGGARAPAPPEGLVDRAALSEPSAQRESPGTP